MGKRKEREVNMYINWLNVAKMLRDILVKGYNKHTGKYVLPYHRTSPDKTETNNYSSSGNINPFTGKIGTKNPNK